MRGFVSVIVALGVFLVAILLINVNYYSGESFSYKEEMLSSKILMTNYEIALNRAMEGKNLGSANLDGASDEILEIITPVFTKCTAVKTILNASEADVFVNCVTNVVRDGETVFKNEFSKTIKINS